MFGSNTPTLMFGRLAVDTIRASVHPSHKLTLLAFKFDSHLPFMFVRLTPTTLFSMLVLGVFNPNRMHYKQH